MGITFLIVAIIVGIGVAFYIRRWKKKKDLELLGKVYIFWEGHEKWKKSTTLDFTDNNSLSNFMFDSVIVFELTT